MIMRILVLIESWVVKFLDKMDRTRSLSHWAMESIKG